ncbi:MAG TPA: PKD domain-containing protein, partial [Pseudobdellovibrionaceae bacterium]|nr:PKD domain-containing protein [Pseudobdellovibrionaceae bacterium]
MTATDSEGAASSSELVLNVEDRRRVRLASVIHFGLAVPNAFFGYTTIPQVSEVAPTRYRFSGKDSISSFGSGPLKHRWTFGDGAIGFGQSVEHTYRKTGTYLVEHRVENQFGEFATSQVTVVVHPLACLSNGAATNTCFAIQAGLIDQVNMIVDPDAPELIFAHDNTEFDATDAALVVKTIASDGVMTDVSDLATLVTGKVHLNIAGLKQRVGPTQSFSIELAVNRPQTEINQEEEPTSEYLEGFISTLRFPIARIDISLPSDTTAVSLNSSEFTWAQENPGSFVQIQNVPVGEYLAKAYHGSQVSEHVVIVTTNNNIQIDLTPPPAQQTTQKLTRDLRSKGASVGQSTTSSDLQKTRIFPDPTTFRVSPPQSIVALTRVNPFPELYSSPQSALQKSARMQSTSSTTGEYVEYESFCGERPTQFRIVSQSISSLPDDGSQYSRLQTNAPDLTSDPSAEIFASVREVSRTNEVEIYCGINGASMADQFNTWSLQANRRCCAAQNINDPGGLAICNSTVSANYMDIISTYYQDDFPVDYYVTFRDRANSRVVQTKHSFTLNQAARTLGLNRNMMADLFGLPATTRTPGWYIPYRFTLKIPEGMTEPEFSVKALSQLPTSGNNYFCWVKGNAAPIASAILMADTDDISPLPNPTPEPIEDAASQGQFSKIKPVLFSQFSLSAASSPSPSPSPTPEQIFTSINRLYDPTATGIRIAKSKLFPLETMETVDPNHRMFHSGLNTTTTESDPSNQVNGEPEVKKVNFATDKPWQMRFRAVVKMKNLPTNAQISAIAVRPVLSFNPVSGGNAVTASSADPISVNLPNGSCASQNATTQTCTLQITFHWQDLKLNSNSTFTTARSNLNIDNVQLALRPTSITTANGPIVPQVDSSQLNAIDSTAIGANLTGQYNVGARSTTVIDSNSALQTQASNWNYRCPAGYSGYWVAYGQRKLARFVRDHLRAMNLNTRTEEIDPASGVTNDFAIACNDGSLPFG